MTVQVETLRRSGEVESVWGGGKLSCLGGWEVKLFGGGGASPALLPLDETLIRMVLALEILYPYCGWLPTCKGWPPLSLGSPTV
jgi:hypothetical protein